MNQDAKIAGSLLVVLIVVLLVGTVATIRYDQTVTGYLKRAADASSVETASVEIGTALRVMEQQGDTTGYTSVLWRTPDDDIAFWYRNIRQAKAELDSLPATSTPLEQTNVLMKIRETLLDDGKSVSVTHPGGIGMHPYNAVYIWSLILLTLAFLLAAVRLIARQ